MQTLPDREPAVQALMLASRALVGLTVRALADLEVDVTIPQFRALVVLSNRGSMRGADIADELNVNPSTGTRMTDRLVGKGLVRRVRSTDDRRVVQLRLTKAGRDVVEDVMTKRRAELERIVTETASLWQPAVTEALTAFATAAGEMPEQEWWLGWARSAEES
ncbi:MarR family transcriptional regulator [Actinoplanes sp. NPDC026619]|uniref:MarR family transcriptional regulator n=1 Tax=Actinoplanes sp. NPDC026619 TaxID=3155798 RepID=UPI003403C0AC